jgi:hypothetical protein
MGRFKPARGKKKLEPAGRSTAIGCVTVIVLVLLFFVAMFWLVLRQN